MCKTANVGINIFCQGILKHEAYYERNPNQINKLYLNVRTLQPTFVLFIVFEFFKVGFQILFHNFVHSLVKHFFAWSIRLQLSQNTKEPA